MDAILAQLDVTEVTEMKATLDAQKVLLDAELATVNANIAICDYLISIL